MTKNVCIWNEIRFFIFHIKDGKSIGLHESEKSRTFILLAKQILQQKSFCWNLIGIFKKSPLFKEEMQMQNNVLSIFE